MNNDTNRTINSNQMTVILIGFMIGVGVLNLPNVLLRYAKQDAWFAAFIGAVYPAYMIILVNYMSKKCPKENILVLSKKYFGNILGKIFNLIFGLFFLYNAINISKGITNLLNVYMVGFLSPVKVILVILFSALIMAEKRIDDIGRINQVIFYGTLILFFVPIVAIKEGSMLNLQPVFESGFINILKASKESVFAYSGIEVIFLLYPQIDDIKQLKKCGIKSILVVLSVYVWFAFITIFYLGIDIIPKFLWSTVHITETLTIPVVNNFRYVFSFLWSLILFRTLGNYYFATAFILSDFSKKLDRKKVCYLMYPVLVFLSTKFGNEIMRRDIQSKTEPLFVLFNLIIITILCLMIAFKRDESK